jgi:uncharacterized coiled-coil protein SlyX
MLTKEDLQERLKSCGYDLEHLSPNDQITLAVIFEMNDVIAVTCDKLDRVEKAIQSYNEKVKRIEKSLAKNQSSKGSLKDYVEEK